MRHNGKQFYRILIVAAILVLSAGSYEPVKAIPEYTSLMPPDLKNFCNVCHVSNAGGPLNSFGDDFTRYDFDQLMELDSDSDGYTNGDELDAGKHPGDEKSFPGKDKQNTKLLIGVAVLAVLGAAVYLKFIKK